MRDYKPITYTHSRQHINNRPTTTQDATIQHKTIRNRHDTNARARRAVQTRPPSPKILAGMI